jgi:hypothetical protein
MVSVALENPLLSKAAIAKKAKVSPKVVHVWLPVFLETGSVANRGVVPGPKPGSHNLGKTAAIEDGVESMRGVAGVYAPEAATSAGVSTRTMRRAAHAQGMDWGCTPRKMKLSASDKARRLEFAKQHKDGYEGIAWKDAFFVDATPVWAGVAHSASGSRKNIPTWDTVGQHKGEDESAHSLKGMAYAGICRYGATPLIFVTGTSGMKSKYVQTKGKGKGQLYDGCCAQEYKNDVVPCLRAQANTLFGDHFVQRWLYLHDRASIHNTTNTLLKKEGQPVVTDWMVKGADVNPIENAWGKLKMEVPKYIARHNIVIRDCVHFQNVLQATWKELTTDKYLQKLCTDVPARLKQVIEKQGGATRH